MYFDSHILHKYMHKYYLATQVYNIHGCWRATCMCSRVYSYTCSYTTAEQDFFIASYVLLYKTIK